MSCQRVEAPCSPDMLYTNQFSGRNRAFAIRGVIRVLSINAARAPVHNSERECGALPEGRPPAYSFIEVGDRFSVRWGLLEGLQGFVLHCKNERRFIRLMVELLEPIGIQPHRAP
jgi:hypothetical protein